MEALNLLQRHQPVFVGLATAALDLGGGGRTFEFEGLAAAEGHAVDARDDLIAAQEI
jgi:hypothetical protein